jgi:hypothetical protein
MAAFGTVLALAACAAAQKNELAGLIGRTFVSDQGIVGATFNNPTVHFGNGLTFEGNYGRRFLDTGFVGLTLEIPAVFNVDEKLNSGTNATPRSYKSIFVTPSVRLNLFSANWVSPWVSFGGGWAYFKTSDQAQYYGPYLGNTSTNTSAIQFGAGLDVRIHGSLSLRGTYRDFYTGVPDLNVNTGKSRQHNYLVSGGVLWRF